MPRNYLYGATELFHGAIELVRDTMELFHGAIEFVVFKDFKSRCIME